MELASSPSAPAQATRQPSAQSPAPRVVGRDSRQPWPRSSPSSRLIVAVPSTPSASPFSRLDLSRLSLGVFPHHD